MYKDGIFYDNPQSIVNAFTEQFSSVYHTSSSYVENIDAFSGSFPNISLNVNIPSVSENDIRLAIHKLKNKPTSGFDQVPSYLIKDCVNIFIPPLLHIFNLCLKTAIFPAKWKLAKVCPIFKNNDPADICNYRPIAILSNFSKVFEMVIYSHIYQHIKNNISPYQHGFVEKRSTCTNLCYFVQFTAEILDKQGQVDVIYTDISKAFDRIDHGLLLAKLKMYGFSDSLIILLTSYLQNRTQSVVYNGYTSESFIPKSGVPQGSNLGPLLFLLFINDLSLTLQCETLMFADDVKIFTAVTNLTDCIELQNNLSIVCEWCRKNKLNLNVGKCKVVSFSRKEKPIHFDYTVGSSILDRCNEIKDLGVYFDYQLTFSKHVTQIVSSANKMLGFIMRNSKQFSNIHTLKTLFFTLVRSRLEYCALIWMPYYNCYKYLIENVQRKFMKYLWFKTYNTYPPRGFIHKVLLDNFKMYSLDDRRSVIALSFLFNLLHCKIDCSCVLSKINFHVPRSGTHFIYNLLELICF